MRCRTSGLTSKGGNRPEVVDLQGARGPLDRIDAAPDLVQPPERGPHGAVVEAELSQIAGKNHTVIWDEARCFSSSVTSESLRALQPSTGVGDICGQQGPYSARTAPTVSSRFAATEPANLDETGEA